jgi:hypothetical protein
MRYIIIERDKGIFLGNYLGTPLFSNSLLFPIVKAYSFNTFEEADEYADYIAHAGTEFEIVDIDCDYDYIPIDILIKNGYSKHTERMLSYIPTFTKTVH